MFFFVFIKQTMGLSSSCFSGGDVRSRQISKQLRKKKKEDRFIKKILLLGTGPQKKKFIRILFSTQPIFLFFVETSGKSTIFQQIQKIQNSRKSEKILTPFA